MPVAVVRRGDDVEAHASLRDVVEPPAIEAVVAAVGQVEHDLGARRAGLDGVVAGLQEPRQVVPVRRVEGVTVGPQHAGVQLVANLDHVGAAPRTLTLLHTS